MTLDDINAALENIKAAAGDPEAAHSMEDGLMRGFIFHVLEVGGPDLQEMASAVLDSDQIKFPRWYS